MATSRREFLIEVLVPSALAGSQRLHSAGLSLDHVAEIEWHIAFLTNQQRIWLRLPPLESLNGLSAVARGHSQDMLARGFFDHRTPEGAGPAERIARQGLRFRRVSENICSTSAATSDAAELASDIVTEWMNSKGHRRNILDPDARSVGVGVAASTEVVLATQLFGG